MANKKVLVVDDDVKIVELVKLYLNRDGYHVITAYDGNEALRLARESHAGPDRSGYHAARDRWAGNLPPLACRIFGTDNPAHCQDYRARPHHRSGPGG